ncbi:MAG: cobalamin-independent methionine synthase II family protein [Chloroflexi bacterium]|nr:cobalamin-independent methionine synthase II family protein [Chloroflexota bacterium]
MQQSVDRILTTHVGSLPRPVQLLALLEGRDQQEVEKDAVFEERVSDAVRAIVRRQVEAGIDVVNDGEMSKVTYATYVTERLTGFDGESREPVRQPAEAVDFPEYYQTLMGSLGTLKRPVCTGPIAWRGDACVRRDIDNLQRAVAVDSPAEAFMTAASPGIVCDYLANDYYSTEEAYLYAVADAMRCEYRAIVDAGVVLQLDAPDLTAAFRPDIRAAAELRVDAINHALQGLPENRVRLHLCWGNSEAPHTRDIPLGSIFDIVVKARAQAISFEAANPRHAHEWKYFADHTLPEGKVIVPGLLDSTTNFVEHPELVAERLVRYAELVGRENVIAGTDCGFSTWARAQPMVHPTVTWAKFKALSEGARLASDRLWAPAERRTDRELRVNPS